MTRRDVTGGCLCGAVRFTGTLTSDAIGACHCKQCQRWTGGGPLLCVTMEGVEMTGEPALFRISEWGERGFCNTCGTTLFWRMQGKPTTTVAVGALDDQTGLTVREEIFVDHRPAWLPVWEGASQSTEAQEFAKLDAALNGAKS